MTTCEQAGQPLADEQRVVGDDELHQALLFACGIRASTSVPHADGRRPEVPLRASTRSASPRSPEPFGSAPRPAPRLTSARRRPLLGMVAGRPEGRAASCGHADEGSGPCGCAPRSSANMVSPRVHSGADASTLGVTTLVNHTDDHASPRTTPSRGTPSRAPAGSAPPPYCVANGRSPVQERNHDQRQRRDPSG